MSAQPHTLKGVAFIPARAGSKRVPDKNVRVIDGHPLIAYTISAALDCGVFDKVVVSTDSERYADIALHYGAECPTLRPAELAGDKSSDIEWVKHMLDALGQSGFHPDAFSILRPTSPCRKPETIQRAWSAFASAGSAVDSLRAVEKCSQHPGKMWIVRGERMHPLMPMTSSPVPSHSMQYAALPEVYVQNASLEIAWTATALEKESIAGEVVMPFLTCNDEGLDINSTYDWRLLELMLQDGDARLPTVIKPAFSS